MILREKEDLPECVRKYPCLYDKSSEILKNNVCVENAWAEEDKQMGLEEGIDIFRTSPAGLGG